jgi:nitroreductase
MEHNELDKNQEPYLQFMVWWRLWRRQMKQAIEKLDNINLPMTVMDAIVGRHAVRSYLSQSVSVETIHALLSAAVRAPTAMQEEAWAFAVVQNPDMLRMITDKAKQTGQDDIRNLHFQLCSGGVSQRVTPVIDVLHGARTLIVIYGKPVGRFVEADCWLAAENLMLAACAHGLGTCVVGMTVDALNDADIKKALSVPDEMMAVAPIIIGYADNKLQPTARKAPVIVSWN